MSQTRAQMIIYINARDEVKKNQNLEKLRRQEEMIEYLNARETSHKKTKVEKQRAAAEKEWKETHTDKITAFRKAWEKKFPDKVLAAEKRWAKMNPGMVRDPDNEWIKTHLTQITDITAAWLKSEFRKKETVRKRAYRKTPNGYLLTKRSQARRKRDLGYTLLLPLGDGEVGHHIDNEYVIGIDKEVHEKLSDPDREKHRTKVLKWLKVNDIKKYHLVLLVLRNHNL